MAEDAGVRSRYMWNRTKFAFKLVSLQSHIHHRVLSQECLSCCDLLSNQYLCRVIYTTLAMRVMCQRVVICFQISIENMILHQYDYYHPGSSRRSYRFLISILHKCDYNNHDPCPHNLQSVISILHKCDYNARTEGTASREQRFQFYISAITITSSRTLTLFHHPISILHKCDYNVDLWVDLWVGLRDFNST